MKKIFIRLLILVLIIQSSFNLIDMIYNVSNAATKIYIEKGQTSTITAQSSSFSIDDASIASATNEPIVKAQLGTSSSYNGDEVELSTCEYTLADAGRGNGTYYATKGNLYLYIYYSRNYINGTATSPLTVDNNNGNMTIHYQTSDYLSFNTTNNYFYAANATGTPVNLYRQATNGETSSTEIPGYVKVSQIVEDTNYLVVKQNGGTYYLLYPVQKVNNGNTNYSETAKIINRYEYTITGVDVGETTMTIGDKEYEIIVYGEDEDIEIEPSDDFEDKALIITAGLSYTLQTNTNSTITWSSENTSIATVNNRGQVTAVAVGNTNIRATVGGVTYTIPVTVTERLATNNYNYRTINVYVDSDDETTAYYNYSHNSDFIKAPNGTRVYIRVPRYSNNYTNFYAAPDDGYALSYMSEWYAPIVEETESEVRSGNGPSIFSDTQSQYFSNTNMANAVAEAYSRGAEGMFGYSTYSNVTETLSIRSEKLPKISQKVYSVNGQEYQNGDTIYPGDTAIFEVTISKGAYDYIVNYDGTLTSNLNGTVFLGTSPTGTGTNTTQQVTISTADSHTEKYYIKYTIPNGTVGNVTNTVTFDYESNGRASNTNSTGAVDSTASYKTSRTGNASATITVTQPAAKSYITITKEVAGNMRETDKYFKFLVTIDGTNGDTYTIVGQDSTITYNNSSVNTSNTYTVGSTNYIYLKGGQTVTIGLASNGTTSEIVEGTTYSIVEQDAEDYLTTISGIQGETKNTGNKTIGATNTVEFLNSKDAAAFTGTVFEYAIYVVIFTISLISIYVLFVRNIKKKK